MRAVFCDGAEGLRPRPDNILYERRRRSEASRAACSKTVQTAVRGRVSCVLRTTHAHNLCGAMVHVPVNVNVFAKTNTQHPIVRG